LTTSTLRTRKRHHDFNSFKIIIKVFEERSVLVSERFHPALQPSQVARHDHGIAAREPLVYKF